MSEISNFLAELQAAKEFEDSRVKGYEEILSFPATLLSLEARKEVDEAYVWSLTRANLINAALISVSTLLEAGYPERLGQIAPATIISELKDRLLNLSLAVAEFSPPPEAVLNVSPEIKV